ncbi:hypothetical protein ACFJIY_25185 [Pimelobacter simplex]
MRVHLEADVDQMTRRLANMGEELDALNRRIALLEATWEPHDWSEN